MKAARSLLEFAGSIDMAGTPLSLIVAFSPREEA
jgi:hypothetical protein